MNDKKQTFLLFFFLAATPLLSAHADSQTQARKLYMSLTGVTPSASELNLVAQKIAAGKTTEAAKDIIDSKNGVDSRGNFYKVTVKNFAAPWSNVDYTTMYPLTDLTATVIGWVRDEKSFNNILFSDSVYVANGVKVAGSEISNNTTSSAQLIYSTNTTDCGGAPKCTTCADPKTPVGRILFNDPSNPNSATKLCRFTSITSKEFSDARANSLYYVPYADSLLSTDIIKTTNSMYEDMEAKNLDLSNPKILVEKSQAVRLHQDTNAISGLMTTRAWGYANYTAGTNRRAFQSTMKHLMCKEMLEINDTNTPDIRVHRDVDRNPGGTAATFKNLCVGCHAVMDAQVGAYAYYNFPAGAIEYKQGEVVSKMNHNAIYPRGYITQDDSWMNLSNQGQNASLGWGPQASGNGLASLAQMYSETKEFHLCMAKTVYKSVCFKNATTTAEKDLVKALALSYQEDHYNMKNLFIRTSIACMGK